MSNLIPGLMYLPEKRAFKCLRCFVKATVCQNMYQYNHIYELSITMACIKMINNRTFWLIIILLNKQVIQAAIPMEI